MEGVRRTHKLQTKEKGSCEVIAATTHTVKIDRDGLVDTITRDRLSKAPDTNSSNIPKTPRAAPAPAEEADIATSNESQIASNLSVRILRRAHSFTEPRLCDHPSTVVSSSAIMSKPDPLTPQKYVVDHVVDYIVEYNPSTDKFRFR